ncbi:MAG: MBL fold metallo-hydrolase [Anaerolineae bacterium]|nr:MBL fold metallo-hydrolase [Anaerolineae bacterium]
MARTEWYDFGNNTYALTGGSNIGAIVHRDKALLIDAGLDRDSVRKALQPIEARDIQIIGILVTHGHADHFGGAAWAARRTESPVYAPPLEGAFAQHPLLEPLFLHGGAAPIRELTGKFTLAQESIERLLPLTPGRTEIGGIAVEVIALYGHAPAQIGIAAIRDGEGARTCYCGDAVFSQETLDRHPILFCSDLDAWLDTLTALQDMSYDIYVAGHGDPIHDIAPLAQATAGRLEEIREVALTSLDKPKEPYDVLRAVAKHFGVGFPAPQFFLLSLTTINAALTSLQRHGQAEVIVEDNYLLWRRVK